MPIYYIIGQYVSVPQGYSVVRILKVIETTLEDAVSGKHSHELNLYYGTGMNVNTFFFEREPENPFRNFTK